MNRIKPIYVESPVDVKIRHSILINLVASFIVFAIVFAVMLGALGFTSLGVAVFLVSIVSYVMVKEVL